MDEKAQENNETSEFHRLRNVQNSFFGFSFNKS
jgi:hypothetical protein